MRTFADSNHWKRWRLTRLPPIEMSPPLVPRFDPLLSRFNDAAQVVASRALFVLLVGGLSTQEFRTPTKVFINLYTQLHFVLESVEPRMPIEFINKFFT